jgi:hypothetical protein
VFARDFALLAAIYALMSHAQAPVDPVAIVGRLRGRHPEVDVPASELLRRVVVSAIAPAHLKVDHSVLNKAVSGGSR